ncbi:RHS repeat-associated core domain-containing protein [Parafrigoribacterium soli]|uniref:RHS repeat-associated core domain-containing protein n=1 Tax=Parafrigoribacterium soli TaxID=3144663 RepID=UPI0032ED3A88
MPRGAGNPAALITDYATQAYAYSFDPYGTAILTAGDGGGGAQQNPYLFKGGIQDRTTGWAHFGARWYNPTTGRFTQQDTLDTPLNPANANRYAYAGDDPLNNLDPGGLLCKELIGEGIAIAAFGVVVGVLGQIPDATVIGLPIGAVAAAAGITLAAGGVITAAIGYIANC